MTHVALSARNKTGLVLAFLLGLVGIPMFLRGAPDPGEIGPPMAVLITESVCGLVTVVAVTVAWRTASPRAIRLAAGTQIVSVLTALPALFVDRPALNKLLLALVLGVTLTAVILMLTPSRRDGTVDQPSPLPPRGSGRH
jgi:glucose-6-phosphate-specific signal transduction histidine kinase